MEFFLETRWLENSIRSHQDLKKKNSAAVCSFDKNFYILKKLMNNKKICTLYLIFLLLCLLLFNVSRYDLAYPAISMTLALTRGV